MTTCPSRNQQRNALAEVARANITRILACRSTRNVPGYLAAAHGGRTRYLSVRVCTDAVFASCAPCCWSTALETYLVQLHQPFAIGREAKQPTLRRHDLETLCTAFAAQYRNQRRDHIFRKIASPASRSPCGTPRGQSCDAMMASHRIRSIGHSHRQAVLLDESACLMRAV